MIAASSPIQRPPGARVLVVDRNGRMRHEPRARVPDLLHRGDLVVANDAATLPASLRGVHAPTGADIEVRLAGRSSLTEMDLFSAVVFGSGDFRLRTEDRPLPPRLERGDRLWLGQTGGGVPPLVAVVEALLGHPRLVLLRFAAPATEVWAGLARHGRPIQYSHLQTPLAMWDVWTPIAGEPVAFEPPSAGFALDWAAIAAMRRRGITFRTLTHAAGLSSTGDPDLDRRLPFAEAYRIPRATAAAIQRTFDDGGRVVAVGTTVVRALEHAALRPGVVRAGEGLADQRVGPASRLQIVDALLTGTHEPQGSHYQMLRAFLDDRLLAKVDAALEQHGYRTHEFGDSLLIERSRGAATAQTVDERTTEVAA